MAKAAHMLLLYRLTEGMDAAKPLKMALFHCPCKIAVSRGASVSCAFAYAIRGLTGKEECDIILL